MTSFNFAIGTLYGYEREYVERDFDRWLNFANSGYFRGCFATYFMNYRKGQESLYYAFNCLPTYFENVLKDLNAFYENIKYEVVKEKDISLKKTIDRNYDPVYSIFNGVLAEIPMKQYLLRNTFDPGYTETSKKYLIYNLSILVRMLNPAEKYVPISEDKSPDEDYVDFLVRVNNKYKGYRSFSEREINRDTLKSFDNIDNCNLAYAKPMGYSRQTRIALRASILFSPRYRIQYKTIGYLKYNYKNYVRQVYSTFTETSLDSLNRYWLLSSKGRTFDIIDAEYEAKQLNSLFKTNNYIVVPAE